ncbi:MAG: membrane dipeptidase [Deferribacteres bacterium]|nr:dipeptidase [candidate division KSB1 bacterium]MCB9504403.1 membrane dipeptidase [Deferribacteres bacterium]
MRKRLFLIMFILMACNSPEQKMKLDPNDPQFSEKARAIHQKSILVDTHIDIPYRITHENVDISQRLADGHFDLVRAKEGGLDAPFFAVYVSSKFNQPGTDTAAKGGAYAEALRIITMIDSVVSASENLAESAISPGDVERIVGVGKIAVCMGMENGAPIEGDIQKLADLYQRGIRYITLTHAKDNHISDSSYDERHTNKGLTEFGKKLIVEMNRIGMMIDVSHISDDAFWQVMELSNAPVIASHSGLRTFRHMERNMSDSMLVALAKNGGVFQYNFGSYFITDDYGVPADSYWSVQDSLNRKFQNDHEKAVSLFEEYKKAHPAPNPDIDEVVRQLDYAIKLIGVDHVGLGSDYDGVNEVPVGLEDVTKYPVLTEKMLALGYTAADIEKINGGNLLRVWKAVEQLKL